MSQLHERAEWEAAQAWEGAWWADCRNTLGEELKQVVYARLMLLKPDQVPGRAHAWTARGARVLDIGAGPVSILLKTSDLADGSTVVDPLEFPDWVLARYEAAGLTFVRAAGEDLDYQGEFDEVWLYNVLQHTQSPEMVIRAARRALRPDGFIRIFEWLGTVKNVGHPHILQEGLLDHWLHGRGKVSHVNENGAVGKAYSGIFPF